MLAPIDLTVLLYLVSADLGPRWTQVQVAGGLGIAQSNVHRALTQLGRSELLRGREPDRRALRDLLVFGVRYVYPAVLGPPARGLATAHAGPTLASKVRAPQDYVWPWDGAEGFGVAIAPLHPRVPAAAARCVAFYELMALVDVMRVGRVREREVAVQRMDELLDAATTHRASVAAE